MPTTTTGTRGNTRAQTIRLLLDNYEDVLSGLRDTKGTGDHLPLMCAAWNHSSYRQLTHLLLELRAAQPRPYHHLVARYLWAPHQRRMVCAVCLATYPHWQHPTHHTHGRRNVTLTATISRAPGPDPTQVTTAVAWLASHWHGRPSLPPELAHLAA